MSDPVSRLFSAFDSGLITRRQLLRALGIGAGVAVAAHPLVGLAQGQCGGARATLPECDPTPAKAPFASTGWKTLRLEHFSMQVGDYQKEAAYFAALMNWKIRNDDGKQATLDVGDWGGMVIRGGFQPPPPAPPPAPPVAANDIARADQAANAARGGRQGGGQGGRQGGAPRAPRLSAVDGFTWGIGPWNTKKVEAELKARGLTYSPGDNKDFASFLVKDPDGFNLEICDGSRKVKRASANAKSGAAPFDSTDWKTIWLDHISFECSNYKESAAFYNALIGWKLGTDEGSQNQMEIGDVGGIIVRRGGGGGRGGANGAPAPRRAQIGHIAFGITPWDADKVKAELDKRGLNARVDTGGTGDIHTAKYQSYHTTTPNGFDLQISNVSKANRAGIS